MDEITRDDTDQDWVERMRQHLADEHNAQAARLANLSGDSGSSSSGGSDGASEAGEAHTTAAMIAATRESLAEIADALRRISAGGYGLCERCRAAIPRERLELLPHARHCVSCQARPG